MRTYEEVKLYKKEYYRENRERLCIYSSNYYKYKKYENDLRNHEIDNELKQFIKKYKKHSDINDNKMKIKKQDIIISFS